MIPRPPGVGSESAVPYLTRRSCGRRRRRAASGASTKSVAWAGRRARSAAGSGARPASRSRPLPASASSSGGRGVTGRARGNHGHVRRHVLGVQDTAAVVARHHVDRGPGHDGAMGRAREGQRRAHAVVVDLQVGNRDRQVVPVLQHEVRLAVQLLGHDDARPAGVEVQRGPTLPQERQEGLLLRWSFGGAHAPRSGLRPVRVLLGSRQHATASFMAPHPRR